MKQRSSSAVALVLASLLVARPGVGQVPAPSPAPPAAQERSTPAGPPARQQTAIPSTPQTQTHSPAPDDGDVVRITSNLVQIDVVVTDKKGKQVTDLTIDDFEILEDNRPQKITNFSYVLNVPTPAASPVAAGGGRAAPPDKNMLAPPPVRLRPEQVRRTIALVVDDLRSSFESVAFVRHALKKFVDEQLQPNDLVAVVRTSAGMGALQQFTSDRRQLHAAVESVKWYSRGSGGISAFAPLGETGRD